MSDLADALVTWAHSEAGARASHAAWVAAMQMGGHDIEYGLAWEALSEADQTLSARVTVFIITAALDGVEHE